MHEEWREGSARAGGGREGEGQARGAWNEESGSMLGQHIKIMASIGADAPYIPIRGKGLRLISIASRYPSPGWRARARGEYAAGSRYVRSLFLRYYFSGLHLSRVSARTGKNGFPPFSPRRVNLFAGSSSNQTCPSFPIAQFHGDFVLRPRLADGPVLMMIRVESLNVPLSIKKRMRIERR